VPIERGERESERVRVRENKWQLAVYSMKYGVQAVSAGALPSINIRLIFVRMKQREQSRAKQQRS
jgi:hypothetical protein